MELKFLLIAWSLIFSVIFLWVLRIKKILTNSMIYKGIFLIFFILIYFISTNVLKFGIEIKHLIIFIPIIIPIIIFWLNKFNIISVTKISVVLFIGIFWGKFFYNNYYVDNYNSRYINIIKQLQNINNLSDDNVNILKIECENILWNCDIIDKYLEESQKIEEAANTSSEEMNRLEEYCQRVSILCDKISYIKDIKKYHNTDSEIFLHTKQQELNYLIFDLEMKLIKRY